MRIVAISATEYDADEFYLVTDLDDSSVIKTLKPIVAQERDGQNDYEIEHLVKILKRRFPKNKIELFEQIDAITI